MDDKEVGELWNQNAAAWTALARAGYDISRDCFNTPGFLAMLPEVRGLAGLDIGCGEGHNTRLVAQRGAKMTAIDIAERFIYHAQKTESEKPLGITYQTASALELPFPDGGFDFAMATMALMDLPNQEKAVAEAFRIIKPGGFFQFSITHPCFQTPRMRWVNDEKGRGQSMLCGEYFSPRNGKVEEWIFSAAPPDEREKYPKFKVPRFDRTLSGWLNLLIATGFTLEQFAEPYPDDKTIKRYPSLANAQQIAFFLIIRCRKGRG